MTGAAGRPAPPIDPDAERDVRAELDRRPMSPRQITGVGIAIGLNAIDGLDVLSVSFAAPGLSQEWGINKAALGVVLAMELVGMCAGSLLLGRAADRYGRRPTILACLAAMIVGMALAGTAGNIGQLALWRIITGIGIGGMVAAINAVSAELANARWRIMCLSLTVIGYPIGAVLGGSVISHLLVDQDWRIVFRFGALVTLAFVPVVWFALPESIDFLLERRPRDVLARVNRQLSRFGVAALAALPPIISERDGMASLGLFNRAFRSTVLLVTLAYFGQITTFYFILKWAPKLVSDLGFPASTAANVLVCSNVGGVIGGIAFGFMAQRFGLKRMTIVALAGSVVMVVLFGAAGSNLMRLTAMATMAGIFTNSGVVGLYAIIAQALPARIRAAGTGFAVGIGRGGSVVSPELAGFLLEARLPVSAVSAIMAAGAAVAILALIPVRLNRAATITAGQQ